MRGNAALNRSEQLGQNMKFPDQQIDVDFAPAYSDEPSGDEAARLSLAISSACVSDFFEARKRLSIELAEATKCRGIRPHLRRVLGMRSANAADTVEESLYWLISAATLAYLALQVLGV